MSEVPMLSRRGTRLVFVVVAALIVAAEVWIWITGPPPWVALILVPTVVVCFAVAGIIVRLRWNSRPAA